MKGFAVLGGAGAARTTGAARTAGWALSAADRVAISLCWATDLKGLELGGLGAVPSRLLRYEALGHSVAVVEEMTEAEETRVGAGTGAGAGAGGEPEDNAEASVEETLEPLSSFIPRSLRICSATDRSSGVVSLMLVYSPSVSFTGRPRASMTLTSSVTSRPSSLTLAKPRKNSFLLETCGVCTSHIRERCTVLSTKAPSSLSLMVDLVCTPNTAAPCCMASWMQRVISSTVTRGRAAS